jgi:hypothetical protein
VSRRSGRPGRSVRRLRRRGRAAGRMVGRKRTRSTGSSSFVRARPQSAGAARTRAVRRRRRSAAVASASRSPRSPSCCGQIEAALPVRRSPCSAPRTRRFHRRSPGWSGTGSLPPSRSIEARRSHSSYSRSSVYVPASRVPSTSDSLTSITRSPRPGPVLSRISPDPRFGTLPARAQAGSDAAL